MSNEETIEELVERIQDGQQTAATMMELYGRVEKFIRSAALKYAGKAEIDDLMQEGFLALYPAVDGYDPSRNVKFLSYAGPWIEQRMKRYVQGSGIRMPSYMHERLRKYRKLCNWYRNEAGMDPPDQLAAAWLDLTEEEIRELQSFDGLTQLASLDDPLDQDDGDTLGDMIPDGHDLEAKVFENLENDLLWDCVDHLPGDAPEIIREHYQEEKNLSVIAEESGQSYSHVIDTKNRALQKLRHSRDVQDVYSAGLKGNGVGQFNRTWTSSVERIVIRRLDGA